MTFQAVAVTEEEASVLSKPEMYDSVQSPDGSGCTVISYMRGRCNQGRVAHYTVKLKMGWYRQGRDNDGCSRSPDYPFGYRFKPACESHDYGYELGRKGIVAKSKTNKDRIDNEFYNQLKWGTCPGYGWRKDHCRRMALRYLTAVKYGGNF